MVPSKYTSAIHITMPPDAGNPGASGRLTVATSLFAPGLKIPSEIKFFRLSRSAEGRLTDFDTFVARGVDRVGDSSCDDEVSSLSF